MAFDTRISQQLAVALANVNHVLQTEHQATTAMIICVDERGLVWGLFSPALDDADLEDLVASIQLRGCRCSGTVSNQDA